MVDGTLVYKIMGKALHTVVGVGLMYLHLCSQCLQISLLLLYLVSFVQDFSVFCCYVFILHLKLYV